MKIHGLSLAFCRPDIGRNFLAWLRSKLLTALAAVASVNHDADDAAGAKAEKSQEVGSDADAQDIAQFQAGKIVGFNRLVLRHKDKVHTLCYRLLGRNDDALDVAQEVFVRVYQGLARFRGDARFTTWLHTVTLNACRNRQVSVAARMSARSESVTSDENGEEKWAASIQGGDLDWRLESPSGPGQKEPKQKGAAQKSDDRVEWSSGSPESDLVRKRREHLLQKVLVTLPFDMRQALVLRDIEGRSYEDIVALTQWEMGTVRSRIHRAREKLREALKDLWE